MTVLTNNTLLGRHPHPIIQGRSYNADDKLVAAQYEELQDALTRSMTRVLTDDPADLVFVDGSTPSAIAIYRVDYTAGNVLVSGISGIIAAGTDVVLIGAGEWGKSYQLDGSDAVVLTADGKTYWCAIVAIIVSGAVELHAVFGDEADDASEVQVTTQQIKDALTAAGITGLQERGGMVVGRIKIQRVAVDTMTLTNLSPATDAGLMAERAAGNVFGAES
jgi:hypothetical protein